jgi:hypothetical protein
MCCFSGPVKDVSNTKIFARLDGGRQVVAYQMEFAADAELAMVLPIPTPDGSAEDALEWVDLERYPDLFDDLFKGFPQPRSNSRSKGESFGDDDQALEVVSVGSFDASFVPSLADFERLDARFRLPEGAWDALPQYADWGFAVFKLKPDHTTVHPMAFWFPTRIPEQLFFPTVHVHDGEVHEEAGFDHTLYCQLPESLAAPGSFAAAWTESMGPAGGFVKVKHAKGVVDSDSHCYMRALRGRLPNQDTLVSLG